mmetsp:Transcript_16678/g.23507  ORF Transcript_16678/g.23507 Transcript_16678/m.23507 type:complete len:528 (+) Transcript_16678:78-1661(+)
MASILARRIVGRSTIPSFSTNASSLSCNIPGLSSFTLDTRRRNDDDRDNNRVLPSMGISHQKQQYRLYHATPKQEILPLVAVAVVGGIGYYSYRALQRMDEEWEDYQWELQQYEKKYGPVNESSSSTKQLFANGTLGVDLGTIHLVLAHKNNATTTNKEKAKVVPTREGARYTFGGIMYPNGDEQSPMLGKLAFEKAYYGDSNQVRYPADDYDQKTIFDVASPAMNNALETRVGKASLEGVRPVVAIPPLEDNALKLESAFKSFLPDTSTFVPEPVAAVWGAEAQALIDASSKDSGPVVVVDVGGKVTTCTAVQKNKVCSSATLPNIGGELWTRTLIQHILDETSLPFLDQDEMAQQRLYQAANVAIAEYNTSNQAHIHIPYISMNVETREAQHLDTKVSRGVLEQKVQQRLKEIIADQMDTSGDIFSPHVPPPTDYASLWTSVLIQLLEQINATPMNVDKVLIVGGGSKQQLIVSSLQQSWNALTGQGADAIVVPELAKRSELVALGAASLPSHHQYNPEHGIVVP